jgi:hypothetical protein
MLALGCALPLTLGACNEKENANRQDAKSTDPAASVPATGTATAPTPPEATPAQPSSDKTEVEGEKTKGGDGSSIELLALTSEMLQKNALEGELACSFSSTKNDLLLVAKSYVSDKTPVYGLINHNGYPERVFQTKADGFNDLLDGIELSGKGLTLEVVRGKKHPTGHEGSEHEAKLVVQRGDGAERTFAGTFSCGP